MSPAARSLANRPRKPRTAGSPPTLKRSSVTLEATKPSRSRVRRRTLEREYVAIDLHLHRSLIVRENEAGEKVGVTRIDNDPMALAAALRDGTGSVRRRLRSRRLPHRNGGRRWGVRSKAARQPRRTAMGQGLAGAGVGGISTRSPASQQRSSWTQMHTNLNDLGGPKGTGGRLSGKALIRAAQMGRSGLRGRASGA